MKLRYYLLFFCLIITSLLLYTVFENNAESTHNVAEDGQLHNTGNFSQLPSAYEDTIADYSKIIDFRLSDTFESDYNRGKTVTLNESLTQNLNDTLQQETDNTSNLKYKWSNMLVEMTAGLKNPTRESFGYILEDINDDDLPELFWVREDYTILAVFTISDNRAKLLDAFWPRYKCVITDSDELYTLASSGAASNDYQVKKLAENASGMYMLQEFGTDGIEYDQGKPIGPIYYEVKEQQKDIVTYERYEELLSLYPFQMGNDWKKLIINKI